MEHGRSNPRVENGARAEGVERDADLTAAIEDLHAEVERAFDLFAQAKGGRSGQYRALLAISDALSAHATVEQELLHPALRDFAGHHDLSVEDEIERQHVMDTLLVELATMVPGERRFGTKVRLLRNLFQQHVDEQERVVLPDLCRGMDRGERERLALDVRAYTREFRGAPAA